MSDGTLQRPPRPSYLRPPFHRGTMRLGVSSGTSIPSGTLKRFVQSRRRWQKSPVSLSRRRNLALPTLKNRLTHGTSARPSCMLAFKVYLVHLVSGMQIFRRHCQESLLERLPPGSFVVAPSAFKINWARREGSFSGKRRCSAAAHLRDILQAAKRQPEGAFRVSESIQNER